MARRVDHERPSHTTRTQPPAVHADFVTRRERASDKGSDVVPFGRTSATTVIRPQTGDHGYVWPRYNIGVRLGLIHGALAARARRDSPERHDDGRVRAGAAGADHRPVRDAGGRPADRVPRDVALRRDPRGARRLRLGLDDRGAGRGRGDRRSAAAESQRRRHRRHGQRRHDGGGGVCGPGCQAAWSA